jgi:sialidase-1
MALLLALATPAPAPGLPPSVSIAFEPPVLVGSSSATHYWFPAHLARSSLSNPEEIIVTAQNRGDSAAVVQGNITEFLISKDAGKSWGHLRQNGPPEYAAVGRAHEQGAFIGPDQTGQDGMVVVGLEGFADPAAPANRSSGGGSFIIPAATLSGSGAVTDTYNLTMEGFPPLNAAVGLAMGDNAIKLKSGTWLMLSYGFAPAADSFPAGCVVAGPPGKSCRYTLYVMAGVVEQGQTTRTAAGAGAGAAGRPIPTRWAYRANISDPLALGAEGPCEPQFAQLKDGRILLLMRYTSTPLMKALSSDDGKTWTTPVASPLWSVYANVVRLPNDVLVASSGRPGIGLWVCADGVGDAWEFYNLAAVHNGLLQRPVAPGRNGSSAMGYHPTLANISSCYLSKAAGVCNDVTPPQTTGYTGLVAVQDAASGGSVVVVTYDRLSNGWLGPSVGGAWGEMDMVFSMRVRVDRRAPAGNRPGAARQATETDDDDGLADTAESGEPPWAAVVAAPAPPWQPSAKCQAAADAWCNTGAVAKLKGKSCFEVIHDRPCDGPMLARKLGNAGSDRAAWRCYSPGQLTPDHKSFNKTNPSGDRCDCSESTNIREVLAKCGSPDPSPAPPAPAPPTPAPAPARGGVAVFTSGQEGYHTFRIPSVVAHPSDARRLLCFCEGRKFSSADRDWNDIVVKTSGDAGGTWGAMRLVWGESTPAKRVAIGNPSPVALHTQPGKVVLVGCRENLDVFAMASTDFGTTWAKPTYLPAANPSHWKFVATGPPQGIQLPNGRLLVASDHMTEMMKGNVSSHAMLSDDGGTTWSLSDNFVRAGNECQVAALPNGTAGHTDGTLIMNSRYFQDAFVKTRRARLTSYSTDAGKSWTAGTPAKVGDLTAYAGDSCEGSTITAGPVSSPLLLFSTPYHPASRRNMTVFTSKDAGLNWQIMQHIDSGASGYSALIALNDTHVGLVYETGGYSALTFRTVSLSLGGDDDTARAV